MSDANARPRKTVTLENPIKRGELEIREVTVRKPTAGELRGLSLQAIGQSDVNSLITLIPRISEPVLVTHEVEALEPEDLSEFGSAVFDFFLTAGQRQTIATMLGG